MMYKFLIEGGTRLEGSVKVSGAKNAALPCMAATILTDGESKLDNIPDVADIRTMQELLEHIKKEPVAPYEIVKTMRASSLILGPMLARFGKAKVSLPGGCAIGARPMNLHLSALEAMGAEISFDDGYVIAKAGRLKGAKINFNTVTVTGTENIMMAAVLADGQTVLINAAREPEVVDLANYLNKMGAKISGAGTDTITINGVGRLSHATHTIIPDRIEAGTLACAAAITGGDVTVENCPSTLLEATLNKLQEAGCTVRSSELGARSSQDTSKNENRGFKIQAPKKLKAVDIITTPFPGLATDLQAQLMACMTLAEGVSHIKETIFENRFIHAQELNRLGADIIINGDTATVSGVDKLNGASVMASDLRASASLAIAGLAAEGTTEVLRIYHLDRGYVNLEGKLNALGARIKRVVDK